MARDAGLCTALCCGVLQNQALLDYYIDLFLTGRKRLPPVLRDILRLAVYQIVFLDRVPAAAAVNEAVKQTKSRFGSREAGLCNGVLRNMLRQRERLELPTDYAVRYSHPGWTGGSHETVCGEKPPADPGGGQQQAGDYSPGKHAENCSPGIGAGMVGGVRRLCTPCVDAGMLFVKGHRKSGKA